jgi:Transmembrane secretion effector
VRDASEPRRRRLFTRGGLAPLAYRDFAAFQVGWMTTRFGRAVEETGVLWVIYDRTGSAALLGLIGLVTAVPALSLGAIAGVVADRVDQRTMLLITQILGGIASLIAGLMLAFDSIEIWQLYVLVTFEAILDAFDGGARQALFPRLVPRSLLSEAVTMNTTSSRLAQLIGPVVGGLAIAGISEAAPFLLNAASFLGLIGAVAMLRPAPPFEDAAETTLMAQMREGFRYVRRSRVISGLFLLETVVGVVEINSVIITVFGREILDVGPQGLGGLLAAPALGSILALFGILAIGHARRQGRYVLLCGLAYAIALTALATTSVYLAAVGVLVVIGLLDSMMTVTRHTIVQLVAPDAMRGRIMGVMGTITRGTGPVGEMQSGGLASLFGPAATLVVAGAALGLAASATALTNRQLWQFRQTAGVVEVEVEDEADTV